VLVASNDPGLRLASADAGSRLCPASWAIRTGRDHLGAGDPRSSSALLLTRTRFGVRIIATGGHIVGGCRARAWPIRARLRCGLQCSPSTGRRPSWYRGRVKYGTLDPGQTGIDYIPLRSRRLRDRRHRTHRRPRHGDMAPSSARSCSASRGRADRGRNQHQRTSDIYVWRRDHLRHGAEPSSSSRVGCAFDRRDDERRNCRPDQATPVHERHNLRLEVRGRDEALWRALEGPPRHRPSLHASGRGARARWRQRRRQEHARKDPQRLPSAGRAATSSSRGSALGLSSVGSARRAWDRDRLFRISR